MAVKGRQLFERQGKDRAILMRFEPFREFERITEEMLAERRVRQAPVAAYRRGDQFKGDLDLSRADPGSIKRPAEKDVLTVGATRTPQREEGGEVLVAERGHGQSSRQVEITHEGSVAPAVEAATTSTG